MDIFQGLGVWQTLFFAIGVAAVATIFVSLFVAIGERTKFLWATSLPKVGSEEFLQAISQTVNSPVQPGGEIKILNNGAEFVPALFKALSEARQSINFTAYLWEPGRLSDSIMKILIERARNGVEVRLLLDHLGAFKVSRGFLRQLQQAGGVVERFRTPSFGKLLRLHRRSHRRAIIVDGKIAFTGGMAVGDKWYGGEDGEPEWRDIMFELRGAEARALQGVFAELWAGTRGEILVGDKFYPPITAAEPEDACRFVSVASSPAPDTQPLPKFFWLSMSCAKQRLYIASPYVVPDKHIRKALIDRARAGVDVRLLVPNEQTDAKPIWLAMQYYYRDYLKAGIRIFEYQPRMMHSKFLVADGVWSVIGSANMDVRSKRLNEENVLGVLGNKFAGQLEQLFFADLQQSREILLKEWSYRGLTRRVLEYFLSFFTEQF